MDKRASNDFHSCSDRLSRNIDKAEATAPADGYKTVWAKYNLTPITAQNSAVGRIDTTDV